MKQVQIIYQPSDFNILISRNRGPGMLVMMLFSCDKTS